MGKGREERERAGWDWRRELRVEGRMHGGRWERGGGKGRIVGGKVIGKI